MEHHSWGQESTSVHVQSYSVPFLISASSSTRSLSLRASTPLQALFLSSPLALHPIAQFSAKEPRCLIWQRAQNVQLSSLSYSQQFWYPSLKIMSKYFLLHSMRSSRGRNVPSSLALDIFSIMQTGHKYSNGTDLCDSVVLAPWSVIHGQL